MTLAELHAAFAGFTVGLIVASGLWLITAAALYEQGRLLLHTAGRRLVVRPPERHYIYRIDREAQQAAHKPVRRS